MMKNEKTTGLLIFTVICGLLLFAASAASQGAGAWTNLGLYGGQVFDIAIDSNNPDKMFAATYMGDGLFLTEDGGNNWQPVEAEDLMEGEDTFKDHSVWAVEIAPSDSNIVLAGHEYWVEKSSDGGKTWTHILNSTMQRYCDGCGGYNDSFRKCKAIAIDPIDSKIVYVGTAGPWTVSDDALDGAIYKTQDGGQTWTKVNQGNNFDYQVVDIAIDPQDPSIIWAVTNSNGYFNGTDYVWDGTIYRSEDKGENWTAISPKPTSGAFTSVSPKPDDSSVVFTTCGYGVIRSEFDGSQWQHSNPVPGGTYASNIGFAPGNPDVVYATWFFPSFFGGDNLPRISRSTDGGDTWETFMVDTSAATVLLTLSIHPTDSDIVFCGDNELGVVKTPNYGQTWTSLNNGLNAVIVYDVALDPNDTAHKIVGTGTGLFEKKETGFWEKRLSGVIKSVLFHPSNSDKFYAGATGVLAKTINGGADWSYSNYLGSDYICHIAVDPKSTGTIFIAYGQEIQRSFDDGESFTSVLDGINQNNQAYPFNVVEIDPSDSLHIFAGGGRFYRPKIFGDLWESVDGGNSWQRTGLVNTIVNDILIDPGRPQILYAGCGYNGNYDDPLYKSTDGGVTWTVFENGLPNKRLRLIGIWADSPNNMFTVGWDGTIFHYNGTDLTTMNSGTTQRLWGIYGLSSTQIYAAGLSGTIIHYDGNNWSTMDSGTTNDLYDIWGNSSTNLYAVGNNGTVLRYDGNIWTSIDTGSIDTLYEVFGFPSGHVFAAGTNGTILRYDGTSWSSMDSRTTEHIYDIWGTSETDVFAVGDNGTILHFNGTDWTSIDSGTTQYLCGVWGSSSSDVYAVGFEGRVLHYDGTSWTESFIEKSKAIGRIWGVSSTDIFVSDSYSGIFHYNGTGWTTLREPGTRWRSVTDLEFHKSNTNIIYAATYKAGIFVSPNQAGNWLNLGTPEHSVFAISTGSLYAATEGGLLQCTGTGVIAGNVTDSLSDIGLDSATVSTDFGNNGITISGEYMIISPAGTFNVFAFADNYDVKIENDVTVLGGDVSWVNFQLPDGTFDESLPFQLGNQTHQKGGDYCFITAAKNSPSLETGEKVIRNISGLLFLTILSVLYFLLKIRNKPPYIILFSVSFFLLFSVYNATAYTIFEQIGVASPPVPVGSGARAMGMGGTFIGIADDATAASWNPAGLIQLEKPEISIVCTGTNVKEEFSSGLRPEIDNTGKTNDTNISYFSATYPFYFHRGMVVSINYQRLYEFERNFNHLLDYSDADLDLTEAIRFDQKGFVGAVGLAGAVEISPRLSVGAALNIWTDELMWKNGWDTTWTVHASGTQAGVPITIATRTRDEFDYFRGVNVNIGLLWNTGRFGTLGAMVKTPFTATLSHQFCYGETKTYGAPVNMVITDPPLIFTEDVKLRMPISYGLGWSLRYSDALTIGVDIYRTDWDQYTLTDSQGNRFSPIDGRPKSESDIDETFHIRCGYEYLWVIPAKNMVVPIRTGIFFDPEPSPGSYRKFYGFSAGTGIAYKRYVFDVAYQFRWGNDVDSGNLIATSKADTTRHTLTTSLIVHF